MTVSLAYNGEGLGTVWGSQKAEQMLKEAGFSEKIQVKQVPGDIMNYYYVCRRRDHKVIQGEEKIMGSSGFR